MSEVRPIDEVRADVLGTQLHLMDIDKEIVLLWATVALLALGMVLIQLAEVLTDGKDPLD